MALMIWTMKIATLADTPARTAFSSPSKFPILITMKMTS